MSREAGSAAARPSSHVRWRSYKRQRSDGVALLEPLAGCELSGWKGFTGCDACWALLLMLLIQFCERPPGERVTLAAVEPFSNVQQSAGFSEWVVAELQRRQAAGGSKLSNLSVCSNKLSEGIVFATATMKDAILGPFAEPKGCGLALVTCAIVKTQARAICAVKQDSRLQLK